METIDREAIRQARSPLNIDNFSDKYKTESGVFTFTSPSLWVLEKNYFYLLAHSTEKEFESKYRFRPSYLSYDEYGTVILDFLLMYVNNVKLIEDFKLNTVVVPDMSAIVEMCEDKIPRRNIEEISQVKW